MSEESLLDEHLPTITIADEPIVFHPLKDVQKNDSIEIVKEIDLVVANTILKALYSSWGGVKSISGVCRLADATFKAIENRRKILLLPYGAPTSGKERDIPIEPL